MKTELVRQSIRLAHRHEQETGHLDQLIAYRLPEIHHSIHWKGNNPKKVLKEFVYSYVDRAPDFMDAAMDIADKAGIEEHIKPVMKLAEQFFLSPPLQLHDRDGLDTLLNESYLAHRLVEEVNDRYIQHIGKALIPLNTMTANLVAHQLIGETFANRLDNVVFYSMKRLSERNVFSAESVARYRQALKNPRLILAWQQWPCLSRQYGVELKLKTGLSVACENSLVTP